MYNIGCRAGKGTSRFVGVNLDSCATKTEALYEGRMRDCPSSRPILFNRDAAP